MAREPRTMKGPAVRVAVTGATGVLGSAAVRELVRAGHEVVGLARTPDKARQLSEAGATAVRTSLLDHTGLVQMLDGADAVCNLATHVPVGVAALRPGAWRINDRLRTDGVRRVLAAAREAGVRRVVQESVSFLYADEGEDWIDEDAPLDITPATEPASVGESLVQEYSCDSRVGVVLRFGTIVGDDPLTRFQVRLGSQGRPIGLGRPDGWAHVVHTDDLGPAVLAALSAPSGVYNVGAEPVRRQQLVAGFSRAAGRESIDFMGPVMRRLGGVRLEPLGRSLRVSSERFSAITGWAPRRQTFDASWLDVVGSSAVLR
jgi:nucleoside-diphosphate-sugar epimerase